MNGVTTIVFVGISSFMFGAIITFLVFDTVFYMKPKKERKIR